MGKTTIPDDIPTHSVLDFLQMKPELTVKGEESQKSATPPPSWKLWANSTHQ